MFGKIKGMTNKMTHIVEKLKELPQAEDFLNPYTGDEEYDRVIQYKMDLSTVSNKLKSGAYKTMEEFFFDLNSIWKNCQYYNKDDSQIYKNSRYLEQLTGSFKLQIEHESDISKQKKSKNTKQANEVDKKNGPQRISIAYLLKTKANDDGIMQTINMIAEYCPEALVIEGEDLYINLNRLDKNVSDSVERCLTKNEQF